jgi:membrane protein
VAWVGHSEEIAPRPSGGGALRGAARLVQRVWSHLWADDVLDRAAALSYYLVFALFPSLLFLTALVGLLPWRLMDLLISQLDQALPSDVVHRTFVEITQGARGSLLSIGIAGSFWAASSGMVALMNALNAVNEITDSRPWWRQRLVAFGLTLGFALFTLGALVLLIFGEWLSDRLTDVFELGGIAADAWVAARWLGTIAFAALGVRLVYQFAPAHRPRWRWMSPGAVFAVSSWLLMSLGLRFYVSRLGNYSVTYGSIAGVILTLLWLYLTGLALLIGAEIDAELRAKSALRARGRSSSGAAEGVQASR